MNHLSRACMLLIVAIVFLPLLVGCGGGGGGNNTDPASMVPALCAGTITKEGSGEQNILFAAVKGAGSGVSGWVEDQNGKKIANLSYVSAANAQEATLTSADYPLAPGRYTLHYTVNTETFSVTKDLSWGAALPRFQTAPSAPTSSNRIISVGPVSVNSGTASYYLRVYSGISDFLYSESSAVPGGVLTEYLPAGGDQYRIMVVADVIENGLVVATARYLFNADSYN
ncbi:MAG: hypothetical protein GQF41_0413 [Candidatus Rifleibacterium amylolyticum]|nr:MAG: hypothetical protein GQF41_0413 [Candidatus Rifleibacterium amylolyticum]